MAQSIEITDKVPFSAKVALSFACFFWAISFIATKVAVESVPPLTLVTLRLLISSLCFLIWFLVRGQRLKYEGLTWLGQLFLLSLFGTGLHYSMQTIGLQYTTASNASLYAVTGPISILIIAVLFMGEKLTMKKGVGLLTAITGVIIVMGLNTLSSFDVRAHLWGDLLVFTSIFMWGIFTVLGKNMTKRMNALELTAIVTFIGSLYMIPFGWIEMQRISFSMFSINTNAWLAIAFLGITCSFLATMLYFVALEKTESQKVGVYLYTIPPMTYIIAAFYLGENIGLNLIIGSVFVLAGVYITENG
jgi:drug/metabolite transporter (DMT)-like permease